jgi:hypothetical protein
MFNAVQINAHPLVTGKLLGHEVSKNYNRPLRREIIDLIDEKRRQQKK